MFARIFTRFELAEHGKPFLGWHVPFEPWQVCRWIGSLVCVNGFLCLVRVFRRYVTVLEGKSFTNSFLKRNSNICFKVNTSCSVEKDFQRQVKCATRGLTYTLGANFTRSSTINAGFETDKSSIFFSRSDKDFHLLKRKCEQKNKTFSIFPLGSTFSSPFFLHNLNLGSLGGFSSGNMLEASEKNIVLPVREN